VDDGDPCASDEESMDAPLRDLMARFHAAGAAASKQRRAKRPPETGTLLKLYSYYKQATAGDVKGLRPSRFLDWDGIARYDAWAKLKGMSRHDAIENYIGEVALLNRE
jgi:acyl-CoA-binding protein